MRVGASGTGSVEQAAEPCELGAVEERIEHTWVYCERWRLQTPGSRKIGAAARGTPDCGTRTEAFSSRFRRGSRKHCRG